MILWHIQYIFSVVILHVYKSLYYSCGKEYPVVKEMLQQLDLDVQIWRMSVKQRRRVQDIVVVDFKFLGVTECSYLETE